MGAEAMTALSGGDKLQATLDKLARGLKKGGVVRVGFLEGATYPDGTSVPLVAAINEFGAPSRNQPPRPFFRRMIAAKSGEWSAAVEANLKVMDYDAVKTLQLLGAGIKGQLQQSIVDLVDPPLAPSTIRRKGFDKPLIDTSTMLNSVDFEVEET
jgi:hypothetical protein